MTHSNPTIASCRAGAHLWKVGLWFHKKRIGAAAIAVVWFWLFASVLPTSLRIVLATGLAILVQVIYSLDRRWDRRRTTPISAIPFSRARPLPIPATVISVGAICTLLLLSWRMELVRRCCASVSGWLPAHRLQRFTTFTACFLPTDKRVGHCSWPQFFGRGWSARPSTEATYSPARQRPFFRHFVDECPRMPAAPRLGKPASFFLLPGHFGMHRFTSLLPAPADKCRHADRLPPVRLPPDASLLVRERHNRRKKSFLADCAVWVPGLLLLGWLALH